MDPSAFSVPASSGPRSKNECGANQSHGSHHVSTRLAVGQSCRWLGLTISPWTPLQGALKGLKSTAHQDFFWGPRRYNLGSNGVSTEVVGARFLIGLGNHDSGNERSNLITRTSFMRRGSRLEAIISRTALLLGSLDMSIPPTSDHGPRNVAETAFVQHVAILNPGSKVPPQATG